MRNEAEGEGYPPCHTRKWERCKSFQGRELHVILGFTRVTGVTWLKRIWKPSCQLKPTWFVAMSYSLPAKPMLDSYFEMVELGAGDGKKTKQLLRELVRRDYDFSYHPVDISANILEHLEALLFEPEHARPGGRWRGAAAVRRRARRTN